ncbi:prepilin peptidase [Bacillus shivajii]|uniref:A24 family peptidase n=1 Tax=Bacillus shivajii TaxID=1983719 RepID=UPI001CF9784C|nr:prepilin peptidase [Bacillus shivajii]UCZ53146.1 prepilin peptidase [Bacillus shivajii]
MTLLNSLLVVVLIICIITDIKSRKIYNKVLYPALVAAFLLNALFFGWEGLLSSLLGFLVGLLILLIPYLMGGMGAGDVKLLAVIGAVKGAAFVFTTAIYMAVFGGLIALGVLLFRKGLLGRLKSAFYSLCGMKYGMKFSFIDQEAMKKTYPYGVAIVAGAFVAFLSDGVML